MQKTQKTTKEVDVNKVVRSLLGTISDLQLRIAVLEAELEAALDSSGGGDKDAGVRSAGKHHGGAEGS